MPILRFEQINKHGTVSILNTIQGARINSLIWPEGFEVDRLVVAGSWRQGHPETVDMTDTPER